MPVVVIVALVALRFAIGFHFYREGASKVADPGWSSAGFLGGAKGPLADSYKSMLKDDDGLGLLNYDADAPDRINVDKTLRIWGEEKERLANYYGFDEAQRDKAEVFFERNEQALIAHFQGDSQVINDYFDGLARRERNATDPVRQDVDSLREQSQEIAAKLRQERDGLLAPVRQKWKTYEDDLNSIATWEQRAAKQGAHYEIARPGDRLLDIDFVDRFIPIFDITVGALLMFGLLTRLTSVVASLFLCSVMLSQWPLSYGAASIEPQLVEMVALLVLAAVGAGRWAGLDAMIGRFCTWCCPPKREGTGNES